MAKSNSKPGSPNSEPVNKSEAIRAVLAQNPKAKSKEVVALLGEKGVKVQPSLVYFIKSKQNQQKRRQRRERVAETSRRTGSPTPVELILKVKALARDAGGFGNLKQLVDVLAE